LPLYEYVCANGHITEVMHGIHGEGPAACPTCGATVRKAFAAPTFVFKGSGWAKMDRRAASAARKPSSSTTAGEDGTSAGSGDSKGDAKPATDSGGATSSGSTDGVAATSAGAPESSPG
jgi:putative FmdB family regulatory protein